MYLGLQSPNSPEPKRQPLTAEQRRRRAAEQSRERRLRYSFNITSEEYEKVLMAQGGVCAITKERFRADGEPLVLAVDHDHQSGLLRGILSMKVNQGLAFFDDNPAYLRNAAEYLENNPVTAALGEPVYGLIGKSMGKKGRKKKDPRYGPKTADNPKGTKTPQPRKSIA
jgi:hypothetical protein